MIGTIKCFIKTRRSRIVTFVLLVIHTDRQVAIRAAESVVKPLRATVPMEQVITARNEYHLLTVLERLQTNSAILILLEQSLLLL